MQAANVAKTRAYGMELIANAQLTREWLFTLNYTLMEGDGDRGAPSPEPGRGGALRTSSGSLLDLHRALSG